MNGSGSKGATPGFSDSEQTLSYPILTDGGLDAETVANTVDPGDVVVIADRPHRVVEQEAALLFTVDMTHRPEEGAELQAAACGDVNEYYHRSEETAIVARVDDARRDNQEDDVDEGDGIETDGGEEIETEWTLLCLDCDFEMEMAEPGHPREGPPDVVRDRVTLHKHATDESHIVRVEGRRADQGDTIDPSLVTDGGVTLYKCEECGEVERCNVDDAGQRRCPDCGRAVTAVVTDGGEAPFAFRVGEIVREIDEEVDDSTDAEAMLYARCSAAFEDAVNGTDLPAENALGVMTAALFEAADQSGYDRADVIETAREHYIDEEVDA